MVRALDEASRVSTGMASEVTLTEVSTGAADVRHFTAWRRRAKGTFSSDLHQHPKSSSYTMTSPTRPVNIVSPRFAPAAGFGTPGSRRDQGTPGSSPVGTTHFGNGPPDLR